MVNILIYCQSEKVFFFWEIIRFLSDMKNEMEKLVAEEFQFKRIANNFQPQTINPIQKFFVLTMMDRIFF